MGHVRMGRLTRSALGFGVSCLGQGDPQTIMYANLGPNNRQVKQGVRLRIKWCFALELWHA